MPDKKNEHFIHRYNRGFYSSNPKPTDYWHNRGYEDSYLRANTSKSDSGPGAMEFLVDLSAGKSWTKWTGLTFALAAVIYCVIHSVALAEAWVIVSIAAFVGLFLPSLLFLTAFFGLIALSIYGIYALTS